MIVWAFLMAALLQPRFMDWPEPGKDGTALIESVGCRSVRIFEDGYVALTEGANGRAQLLFARGIAEGECRIFEGGEKVIREIGWFYMNARWTDALAPGQSWEAIRVHPESDTPYAALDVIDAYWGCRRFLPLPERLTFAPSERFASGSRRGVGRAPKPRRRCS